LQTLYITQEWSSLYSAKNGPFFGHELYITKPKTSLYSKKDHIHQNIFAELTSQEWSSLYSARAACEKSDEYGPLKSHNFGEYNLYENIGSALMNMD